MEPFIIPSASEGFSHTRSWDSLQKHLWIQVMAGVPQDPVHHAEGEFKAIYGQENQPWN